jgi:dihydrodipicolinate synthase/N-acetylneuraminate lyase
MTNAERAAAHAAFAESLIASGVVHTPSSFARASAHATLAVYYRDLAEPQS